MSALADHEAAQVRRAHSFSRERLLELFTSAPNAFFRHDIDLSLDAAVKMARFAQVAGVSSTFYVMPRSEFYNVFSHSAARALSEILERGHRLGVHSDAYARDAEATAERDLALMDYEYPGWFYRMVSFHMPADDVLWTDFDGFENAYASRWEGRYLSDSRGRPITEPVTDDMQVSLHPEHWQI